MAGTPQLWSLNGLAVELKIYRAKLAEVLATLPADHEDKEGKRWLMHRVVQHLLNQTAGGPTKLDRTQEDARLKRAQTERIELELAAKRAEMVSTDEAGEYIEGFVLAIRQRFLAMPKRVSPVLEEKKATVIESRLKKEVAQILLDLSKMTPAGLVKAVRRANKAADGPAEQEEARR